MDNFDIKRFARTVRWMYRINVKNVLSFAAGLSFGYLFTFIGWLWPLLKSGSAPGYMFLYLRAGHCIQRYLDFLGHEY